MNIDANVKCFCCGKTIVAEETEVSYRAPDKVFAESHLINLNRDTISDDLISYDFDYYIRGLLSMPVKDGERPFQIGAWVEVDYADFLLYVENYGSDKEFQFKGKLANAIKGYSDSLGLDVKVMTRTDKMRPNFFVENHQHPLAKLQKEGIKKHSKIDFF